MCYVRKQLDALYKYKNTGDEEKSLFALTYLVRKTPFSDCKTPFSDVKNAVFRGENRRFLIVRVSHVDVAGGQDCEVRPERAKVHSPGRCPGLCTFAPCFSLRPATVGSGRAQKLIHNQIELTKVGLA